jgi:LacI family gluconate utilization system Gnt-I transcriptional repressor
MSPKRRATLSDVAGRAGVSSVTVSRAIRHPNMVSEKLHRKIDEAVRRLNYIPNHLARALASTRTHIVGAVVPSLTNGVFDDYLSAIQDVFVPAGIMVLVLNVRYSIEEEETAISTLLSYHPEALIVAGIDQTRRSLQLLKRSGIPVVQTMELTDKPIDLNIGLSHQNAGYAAVQYLYEHGHQRISYLAAHLDHRARRRQAGYQRAMDELGLCSDGLVALSQYPPTVHIGGTLFREVFRRAPDVDALFCSNDDLALGALFECQRQGVRVPDDLSIVGFNNLEFSESCVPSLTTVSTERAAMGTWAATSILQIIRGSGKRPRLKQIDVGFSIIERGSTRSQPPV